MNFQKQANYREKKKKAEDEKIEEQKAARKKRDKLRYLKKQKLILQNKQNYLIEQQRNLDRNREAVMVKSKASATKQKQVEDKLLEVVEELNALANSMQKK